MKTIINTIKQILLIFILIGLLTAGIDFIRMFNSKLPIFNLAQTDYSNKIQIFKGLFYQATRQYHASPKESLSDSKEIKFKFLLFNIDIPKKTSKIENSFNIETTETINCSEKSKLYFASEKIKVYTYCLENINIIKNSKKEELSNYLKKDIKILEDIDSELTYLGLYQDSTTLMFTSNNNFTNNGLSMFRCNKENINDIYIGPKDIEFQKDFCTYKDDDLKFMFKIEDNNPPGTYPKEVIYEDENYRYELENASSNNIFIIKPAIRGSKEEKIPLNTIISSQLLTLDDLANKGLKFTKIDKSKITNQ